ncbi:MAG: hypothetical protein DWQ10_09900 [Calditrichaeota bacterium]|nr:MAG: hypothetical protein DWQ10_09900 [Calditrichota bacterium]
MNRPEFLEGMQRHFPHVKWRWHEDVSLKFVSIKLFTLSLYCLTAIVAQEGVWSTVADGGTIFSLIS